MIVNLRGIVYYLGSLSLSIVITLRNPLRVAYITTDNDNNISIMVAIIIIVLV